MGLNFCLDHIYGIIFIKAGDILLDVIHVKKSIDNKPVLIDCNFTVKRNSIFGIVGQNGAGKSTLMRVCCGVLQPDSGSVFFGTETIFDNVFAKRNIMFVPDELYYEYNQSIRDLLNFYSAFYKVDYGYFDELLRIFELEASTLINKLSKGKRKRAYIVIALAISPKVILFDETFDGLDPQAKYLFKEQIKKLVEAKDITVIMTSHSLRELSGFVDTVGFLRNGKIITYKDIETKDDPIYRVLVLNKNLGESIYSSLNVLRKSVASNYTIVDIHSPKGLIKEVLKEHIYAIDEVPFDEWIVYQMEDLS